MTSNAQPNGFNLERAVLRCWFGPDSPRTLSLPEQIAVSLSVRILSLDLAPGARVIEQDIADEFRVSRGPIREALRIIERESLVTISARRGCSVTELSPQEVYDLFEVRAALFAVAARRLAETRSSVALGILDTLIKQAEPLMDQPDENGAYAETIFEHGLQLVEAAGSAILARMIASSGLQTLRYSRIGLSSAERRHESLDLWRTERRAIASGDVEAASNAATARIHRSRDKALEVLNASAEAPLAKDAGQAAPTRTPRARSR